MDKPARIITKTNHYSFYVHTASVGSTLPGNAQLCQVRKNNVFCVFCLTCICTVLRFEVKKMILTVLQYTLYLPLLHLSKELVVFCCRLD